MRKLKAAFWSKFESSRKSFLWARGRWRRIDGLLTRIESYSPSAKRAQARAKLSADFYDKDLRDPMRWHKLAQKETPFVVSGSGSLGPVQRRVNRRMAGFVGGGASREWVLKRQDELRKRQDELDGEPGGFVGDPKNPQFGS
jgi:hypothetical protein